MGKVSTEKLLDGFFGSPEGAKYASKRKLIREEQLYEYEMEIGKELVDMDADDIIKMNWLVDNVVGEIPSIDELDESARELVEMKGV